jgi:hypothetical protein
MKEECRTPIGLVTAGGRIEISAWEENPLSGGSLRAFESVVYCPMIASYKKFSFLSRKILILFIPVDNQIHFHLSCVTRCRYGLIGNPVQSGSGPAAVTPPFGEKGNLFGYFRPLFRKSGMGRLPNGRGSQKTCLTLYCRASAWPQRQIGKPLRVKQTGCSPSSFVLEGLFHWRGREPAAKGGGYVKIGRSLKPAA